VKDEKQKEKHAAHQFFRSLLKKSCALYQRLFGLSVLDEDADSCNLAVADRFVSLGRFPHGGTGYIDHFCFGVDDFIGEDEADAR
jgi:hypothetical protein